MQSIKKIITGWRVKLSIIQPIMGAETHSLLTPNDKEEQTPNASDTSTINPH